MTNGHVDVVVVLVVVVVIIINDVLDVQVMVIDA